MSNHFDRPRILIVTPEIACVPCGREGRSKFMVTHTGELAGRLGRLIGGLYDRGVDIHVAQPDYRQIFRLSHQKEEILAGKKIPSFRARQHIDIYEKMLQRRLIQPERKPGGKMRFNEIRALACDLGINTYRKKKNEIIHSISLTK